MQITYQVTGCNELQDRKRKSFWRERHFGCTFLHMSIKCGLELFSKFTLGTKKNVLVLLPRSRMVLEVIYECIVAGVLTILRNPVIAMHIVYLPETGKTFFFISYNSLLTRKPYSAEHHLGRWGLLACKTT